MRALVWGLGFKVQGLARGPGLGLRLPGLGLRVSGAKGRGSMYPIIRYFGFGY